MISALAMLPSSASFCAWHCLQYFFTANACRHQQVSVHGIAYRIPALAMPAVLLKKHKMSTQHPCNVVSVVYLAQRSNNIDSLVCFLEGRQPRDILPMLFQCWPTVYAVGPAWKQDWVNVLFSHKAFLGSSFDGGIIYNG